MLKPSSSSSDSSISATAAAVIAPIPFIQLYRFADGYDVLATFVICFCAAFSGAVVPLTSLVLGDLLNGTSDATDYENRVNRASLHMALLAVGCLVSLGGGTLLSYHSAARQAQKLRAAYVRALLRQDAAWGDVNSLPLCAARLTEDSLSVQAGTGEKLFLVLAGGAQFIGSFGLAFAVASDAWRLALTLLALMPVAVGAVGFLFAFVSGLSGASDDAYAAAGAVLVEVLGMLRTVVALGGEEAEGARYDACLKSAEIAGRKKGFAAGAGQGIFVSTMCAFYAIGLYAGARFIALNREHHPECGTSAGGGDYDCFSGGTVVQVLFAIVGGVFALGIAAPNLSYLAGARSAAARLHAVIDRTPPIDALGPPPQPSPHHDHHKSVGIGKSPPPPPPLLMLIHTPSLLTSARIVFENVKFSYPSRPEELVLRGVSFIVEPGECVAIVGPSGAGKSSIVSLLCRFYDPNEGRITVNGKDIRTLPVAWLRAQMALVAQEPQLLPVTVRENIGGNDVEAAAAAADISGFIERLPQQYDTLISSSQVSGGQKQRLCLARALARHAAPILLLDEFNSALDSATEERVLRLLAADRSAPPTTVLVAHRLATVRAQAHRVIVLKEGAVVEQGTHDKLVAAGGLYAKLWALGRAGGGDDNNNSSSSRANLTARDCEFVLEADSKEGVHDASDDADFVAVTVTGSAAAAAAAAAAAEGARGWSTVASVPWRRAWALQAPEAAWVVLGCALTCISGVLLPAFAYLLTRFVTVFYDADVGKMVSAATLYLWVFLLIGVFMFFVNVGQGHAFAAFGEPFIRRLRRAGFNAVLAQGVSFLDAPARAPPLLAARLGGEASKLRLALGARMGEKLASLSTLVAGVALCFYASWQLTLVVLLIGPFVILAADAENRVTYGADGEAAAADLAAAAAVAGEAVASIRVVHAFGLEPKVLARIEALLVAAEPVARRRAFALGIGYGASQFSQVVSAAIIFKTGLALAQAGSPGGASDRVFLVFFAFQFACFGLPNLTSLASDAGAIADSLRAFFQIIGTKPAADASGSAAVAWALEHGKLLVGDSHKPAASATQPIPSFLAVPRGRIEFQDVHFSYPTRAGAVLKGLSLTIEPGQSAALVGVSGCGKSSVVSLLQRFYDVAPGSGRVLVDGVDVRDLPPRALRDAIGWVGQEAQLFSETIGYNIAYGRAGAKPESGGGSDAAADDVIAAARAARAHDFINSFTAGYATAVGGGGSGLSGGQRQRVVLARALVRKPRILIIDEGTSALDNQSEKEVQASIDSVLDDARASRAGSAYAGTGTTSLLIAHRLSTVRRCDVIFVLKDGAVVEKGSFEQLVMIEGGLFRSLAQAQGLLDGI
jgi:ATP-binding cassette subfamily B (MDR/TAP) protein 1